MQHLAIAEVLWEASVEERSITKGSELTTKGCNSDSDSVCVAVEWWFSRGTKRR